MHGNRKRAVALTRQSLLLFARLKSAPIKRYQAEAEDFLKMIERGG